MTRIIRRLGVHLAGADAPYVWFLLVVAVLAHRDWFLSLNPIAAGDWNFQWPQWFQGFAGLPVSWVSERNLGYYNLNAGLAWIQSAMGGLTYVGIGFNISERLFFFWPAAILPALGMFFFTRPTVGRIPGVVAGLVYELNTAGLFLGGAHLTHAMAYAVAPLVLIFVRGAVANNSWRRGVAFGLAFALLMAYEPRFAYIVGGVVVAYLAVLVLRHPPVVSRRRITVVATMLGIPALIHAYWLLPTLLYPAQIFSGIPTGLLGAPITLPYSYALYNPFWSSPLANFQVQPLPWFAMLLPLFAFLPLARRRISLEVVFFAMVAAVGVFLTKQNNPPLADVYPWLFANFPGFSVFRESSKFFILIAIGYAVLLGYSAQDLLLRIPRLKIWTRVARTRSWVPAAGALVVVAVVTATSLAPSQGAFANTLGLAFNTTTVPPLYTNLSQLIDNGGFSRTLWFLTIPFFAFHSNEHPALNASYFLATYGNLLPNNASIMNVLDSLSVKYLVETPDTAYLGVPSMDPLRNWSMNVMASPSIQPIAGLSGARAWLNPSALPVIYGVDLPPSQVANVSAMSSTSKVLLPFQEVGADTYQVTLPANAPRIVVLSQGYDGNWIGRFAGRTVAGIPVMGMINGFDLGGANSTTLTISYRAQAIFDAGGLVSAATVILGLTVLLMPVSAWTRLRRRLAGGVREE